MRPLGRLKFAFVQMQLRKGAVMNEEKLYTEDNIPTACYYCSFASNGFCTATNKYIIDNYLIRTKPNDCPLIDIKTHDRELVKEVCEKIKEKAYDFSGYHICECGKKFDTACVDYDDLSEIIEKIQKEFEK